MGFLLLNSVLIGIFIGGVLLDYNTAMEFFIRVVITNYTNFFSDSIERVSKYNYTSKKGLFITLTYSALVKEEIEVV